MRTPLAYSSSTPALGHPSPKRRDRRLVCNIGRKLTYVVMTLVEALGSSSPKAHEHSMPEHDGAGRGESGHRRDGLHVLLAPALQAAPRRSSIPLAGLKRNGRRGGK